MDHGRVACISTLATGRPQHGISLEHLKFIGGILKAPATSIPLEILYDSLRAMPLLDTLIIENALKIPGPAASEIIYLPHLTYFTLMGPGEIVAALYSSVQPYTLATIGLDFNDDTQGSTTLLRAETIASALRAHVARNGAPSYDDLELRQSGGHGRHVIIFDLWSFKAGEKANILFSCSYPTNVDAGSIGKDIFKSLTGALRKADIRQLRLCIEDGPTPAIPDLMKDIFCDATSVEYLLVLGNTIRFLDLLDVSSSSNDTTALFFPRLNRLTLNGCGVLEIGLLETIPRRRLFTGNKALKKLTILNCVVTELHVAPLRELLDVECDGTEAG